MVQLLAPGKQPSNHGRSIQQQQIMCPRPSRERNKTRGKTPPGIESLTEDSTSDDDNDTWQSRARWRGFAASVSWVFHFLLPFSSTPLSCGGGTEVIMVVPTEKFEKLLCPHFLGGDWSLSESSAGALRRFSLKCQCLKLVYNNVTSVFKENFTQNNVNLL